MTSIGMAVRILELGIRAWGWVLLANRHRVCCVFGDYGTSN